MPARVLTDMVPGELSSAEREIFDRILRHANWWRFNRTLPLEGRRHYLAYSREGKAAVLRMKDAAGLAEWRTRRWSLFPDPPVIQDVTLQVLEAIELGLELSLAEFNKAKVWVSFDDHFLPRIIFGFNDEAPCDTALPLWQGHGTVRQRREANSDIQIDLIDAGQRASCFQFRPYRCFRIERAYSWKARRNISVFPGDYSYYTYRMPCPAEPGGPIHGVSGHDGLSGHFYSPMQPLERVQVETGGAFDEGAILEVDTEGRALEQSGGIGVLRALERATTSGEIVRAVFT